MPAHTDLQITSAKKIKLAGLIMTIIFIFLTAADIYFFSPFNATYAITFLLSLYIVLPLSVLFLIIGIALETKKSLLIKIFQIVFMFALAVAVWAQANAMFMPVIE